MQVFHTAGVPPNSGRIILPTIGWTRNSRVALTNSVTPNSFGTDGLRGREADARNDTWGSRGRRERPARGAGAGRAGRRPPRPPRGPLGRPPDRGGLAVDRRTRGPADRGRARLGR